MSPPCFDLLWLKIETVKSGRGQNNNTTYKEKSFLWQMKIVAVKYLAFEVERLKLF